MANITKAFPQEITKRDLLDNLLLTLNYPYGELDEQIARMLDKVISQTRICRFFTGSCDNAAW